jgi:SAM-dependent methyltransferase
MRQFDRHADAYDRIRRRIAYPEAVYQRLAELCGQRHAALDIGCGNGVSTGRLVPYFGEVYGADFGERLIAAARINVPEARFVVAPSEALTPEGFDGVAFDVITCASAFYWMDRGRVVPRVAALLAPGGVFCAYRYFFPVIEGPAAMVVADELRARWAPFVDARLMVADDTPALLARHGGFTPAERFSVPNPLTLTVDELVAFFRSTSFVSAYLDSLGEGGAPGIEALAGLADRLAAHGPTLRVAFDIDVVWARRVGGSLDVASGSR